MSRWKGTLDQLMNELINYTKEVYTAETPFPAVIFTSTKGVSSFLAFFGMDADVSSGRG